MHNSIKCRDITITVDAQATFHQVSLCDSRNDDLANYLNYELAPNPLSLFNDCGKRKSKKVLCNKYINNQVR